MELPAKLRWAARDMICLGLAVFIGLIVLMCLLVALTSTSVAHRQANAVLEAVKTASAISFDLSILHANATTQETLHATGRLQPRVAECTRSLYFEGQLTVTNGLNATEMYVLQNHRGYRRPLGSSNVTAKCLTTEDIPPLHTLADTVRSAFQPQQYLEFHVQCNPVQFSFYGMPFVVCAEDWLRTRLKMMSVIKPVVNASQSSEAVLVIHGKHLALEVTFLSDAVEAARDIDSFNKGLHQCEYLEAPMTSGQVCSLQPIRCPGLGTDACVKREFI